MFQVERIKNENEGFNSHNVYVALIGESFHDVTILYDTKECPIRKIVKCAKLNLKVNLKKLNTGELLGVSCNLKWEENYSSWIRIRRTVN